MKRHGLLAAFVAASITLAIGQQTNAGVVINIFESGADLEATLSGDFDLDATLGFRGVSSNVNFIGPTGGNVAFGGAASTEYYSINVDWTPFGTGPGVSNFWDSMSGDNVALYSGLNFGLPKNYNSQSPLDGSAIKFGASFASAGLTLGTYVTTLTNGNVTDTVTVIIPAPATCGLIGLFGLAAGTRRRKR